MGLLDGGLKATIASAMSGLARPVVLIRETARAGVNEWEPAAKIKTEYSVKGFVLDYHESLIDGTIIQRGDKRILLLAGTCTVKPEDSDTVRTEDGKTFRIVNIQEDPAGATYELHAR